MCKALEAGNGKGAVAVPQRRLVAGVLFKPPLSFVLKTLHQQLPMATKGRQWGPEGPRLQVLASKGIQGHLTKFLFT